MFFGSNKVAALKFANSTQQLTTAGEDSVLKFWEMNAKRENNVVICRKKFQIKNYKNEDETSTTVGTYATIHFLFKQLEDKTIE